MMKQIKKLTAALILAIAVLSACTPKQEESAAGQAENSADKTEAVRVMELQMQTVARSVEYPATLAAYEEVHLVPASPGRIEAILPMLAIGFQKVICWFKWIGPNCIRPKCSLKTLKLISGAWTHWPNTEVWPSNNTTS
jgi:hypothetical protein